MKLSFLPALLFSLLGACATRDLHENKAVLYGGAELLVDIQSPELESFIDLDAGETTTELSVVGKGHVGEADPDVAYLFIIDSSATNVTAGDCGTTAECTKKFFQALRNHVVQDGSAEVIGVINFNSSAMSVAEFQDPTNPTIEDAINNGPSGPDGSSCTHALDTAALMVSDHAFYTADTVIAIFAGDGRCVNSEDGPTASLQQGTAVHLMSTTAAPQQGLVVQGGVANSAGNLRATGTIVYTVAVGDDVGCSGSSLGVIPSNGGECKAISDPATPVDFTEGIIASELMSLEIDIDEGGYRPLTLDEVKLQELPPLKGPVEFQFEVQATGLTRGSHDICVRAGGKGRFGITSYVYDCHRATVWSHDSEDSSTCTVDHALAKTTREITVDLGYPSVKTGLFEITIHDAPYAPPGGSITTSGFCVDVDRSITAGGRYTVDVFSAFDPDIHTQALDKPQYLPNLAWLINNFDVGDTYPASGGVLGFGGCPGGKITWAELQGAIWKLVDFKGSHRAYERVDCISEGIAQDARDNGANYEPDCLNPDEQIPLVMVVDDDVTGEILNQVIITQTYLATVQGMCDCEGTNPPTNPPTKLPIPGSGEDPATVVAPEGPAGRPAADRSHSSPSAMAPGGPTGGSGVGRTGSSTVGWKIFLPVSACVGLVLVFAVIKYTRSSNQKGEFDAGGKPVVRDVSHDMDNTESPDSSSADGFDDSGSTGLFDDISSTGWQFDEISVGSLGSIV